MKKLKLGIVGCGFLADIIVDAWRDGLLEEFEFAGCLSRNSESAERLAKKAGGVACASLDELLAMKPDYVIEAASPAALKAIAEPVLKNGSNLVVLSIGAFADADFYDRIKQLAARSGTRVHLASGAIGGFDVLRTAALMSGIEASISTQKGPASLKGTPVFSERLMTDSEPSEVFSGSAKDAIALFPTKVNVAVACALATPEQSRPAFACIAFRASRATITASKWPARKSAWSSIFIRKPAPSPAGASSRCCVTWSRRSSSEIAARDAGGIGGAPTGVDSV